jgi:hypothetical protein
MAGISSVVQRWIGLYIMVMVVRRVSFGQDWLMEGRLVMVVMVCHLRLVVATVVLRHPLQALRK